MNILRGLFCYFNAGIALIAPQIRRICSPASTATQDIWQKDLDDSLNANLWQHIWGSVYKAV
jgi:hypothetical protein